MEQVRSNPSQLNKFIEAHLHNADVSKQAVMKQFAISENTYFKNLSLAKDEIYNVIRQHLKNPYDDLLLPNVLYRRGLEVHASKHVLKLEEEYEKRGWWNVLTELYSFELMVAYAKCDIKRMQALEKKINFNAQRNAAFIAVDKEIVIAMAMIEKGIAAKDYKATEAKTKKLLDKAENVGHPIPIFNALHCQYLLHSKYNINIRKAAETVKQIGKFLLRFKDNAIPMVSNVANLNIMTFYTTYNTTGNIEKVFADINNGIGKHGLLFDSLSYLNMSLYYFVSGNYKEFAHCYMRFMALPTDRSFIYKTSFLNALKAYAENDSDAFVKSIASFYSGDSNREYDDLELMLRYLEILLLLKDKNYALAKDKLDAATKFARRHFSPPYYKAQKDTLQKISLATKAKALPQKDKALFHFADFVDAELRSL